MESNERAEKHATEIATTSTERWENESFKTEQQNKKAAEKEEEPILAATQKLEANAEPLTTTRIEVAVASPLVVSSASVKLAADATNQMRAATSAGAATLADKNVSKCVCVCVYQLRNSCFFFYILIYLDVSP